MNVPQAMLHIAEKVLGAAIGSLNDLLKALEQKDQKALDALLARMDELLQMNRGLATSIANNNETANNGKKVGPACPICPVRAAVAQGLARGQLCSDALLSGLSCATCRRFKIRFEREISQGRGKSGQCFWIF